MYIMKEQIEILLTEHTNALHKLGHEKLMLIERCEELSKEMTGMLGVINTLKHLSTTEVKNGNIQRDNDGSKTGCDLDKNLVSGKPEQSTEQPTAPDIASDGSAAVKRQSRRVHKARRR